MSGGTGAFSMFPSNPLFIGFLFSPLYLFLYALALSMEMIFIDIESQNNIK